MRGREVGKKGYFQDSFYGGYKLKVRFVELMSEVKSLW